MDTENNQIMKLDEVKNKINLMIKKGWEEYRKYELHTAREFGKQILEISILNNYARGQMIAYYLFGLINASLNRFDLALDDYFEGLRSVINSDDSDSISMAYENVGRCYGQLEDYDKSIEFFKKSLALKRSLSVCNNIGECYLRMNQLDLAYEYLHEAYSQSKIKAQDRDHKSFLFSDICMNLSQVYIRRKESERALLILQEVMEQDAIKKDMKIKSALFSAMGVTYTHLKQYSIADKYFKQAISIAIQFDAKEVLYESYRNYSHYFQQLGDYAEAVKQNDKYLEIRSVLFSKEITNKVLVLSEHFSKEIKELETRQMEIKQSNLEIENKLKQLQAIYARVNGIGQVGIFSEKMKNIMKMVDFFHYDRNVPVIIEGDSGTGKEIIARMIHFNKSEETRPFITLNCSAISATLFESELFGYEDGAFTGANEKGRQGKFELAQGGTLFLDEISDLPLELQPKLLRALQQREIYRVGGNVSIKLDVRIITATNKDLRQEIINKRFRNDLYYRLNTGHIFIPRLQDRKEEIIPLAQMFLHNFSKEKRKHFQYIEPEAVEFLRRFPWQGNVRELRNTIERIVLLYDDEILRREHLNFLTGNIDKVTFDGSIQVDFDDKDSTLANIEARVIYKTLNKFEGNITQTAKYLSTSRNRIYKRKL